jgi:hypothetical protein
LDLAAAARRDGSNENGDESPGCREAGIVVIIGPGEELPVTIRCDLAPDRILPDPDARVLQLERARAVRRM